MTIKLTKAEKVLCNKIFDGLNSYKFLFDYFFRDEELKMSQPNRQQLGDKLEKKIRLIEFLTNHFSKKGKEISPIKLVEYAARIIAKQFK